MVLKDDLFAKTSELLALQKLADHQGWEHEQETLKLQKKIADVEAQRDNIQKEVLALRQNLQEVAAYSVTREKKMSESLRTSQNNASSLQETLLELKGQLSAANQECCQLQHRLTEADERILFLQADMRQAEDERQKFRLKLEALHAALQCSLVLGGYTLMQSPSLNGSTSAISSQEVSEEVRCKTRHLPESGLGSGVSVSQPHMQPLGLEISAEFVQTALTKIQEDLRDAQKKQNEASREIMTLHQKLNEAEEAREDVNQQATALQMALHKCQEEKLETEGDLTTTRANLLELEVLYKCSLKDVKALQEEILTLQDKNMSLQEKNLTLESSLMTCELEEEEVLVSLFFVGSPLLDSLSLDTYIRPGVCLFQLDSK
ncbi:ciliary rootlet coiled-coil protein 2-like [Protopterus annectens]|uniref:ciliary rootlet coiled-coil protein 2-like n=1 Tax=Protopterus annectens TaxID=7888 RepID=UPI001CFA046F|nr:ciliary rootlet coiled-coil protein 2-like [Protopterus annectens]